ncbi:hypothetical protein N1851_030041 [Merluccius polli]|uniref:Integrase catalytic domain-containing protein n=1 Tax=Merluccius polli TaxID=89951 RepID=A0AA47M675_MERPO|nr:hypothetical protein N1851_030041 [Merluccius polli]
MEDLQRLEAEAAKSRAQQMAERAKQEADNAERQLELEYKRRQVERLETIKKLNAAKARLQVYEQSECSDEEIYNMLHDRISLKGEVKHKSPAQYHSRPSTVTQIPLQYQSSPQAVIQPEQENGTAALVRAFTESMSANRLLVPEPTTFSGDPLRFNDWKASYQTLIDRKNIPAEEKLYYLQRYVGGPAKKAIENYFLLGTESAYNAAWTVLPERYGSPFLIAKAFRNKLDAWPKISTKGSTELQEFTDFLASCEAAMSQMKGLEVLNDCHENQKILTKLPDWLTARWSRKVIEEEEQSHTYPSFSQFVKFLTREAKISCHPVSSLHALKPSECERFKVPKSRGPGAKVLATNSDERVVSSCCDFCEKTGHSLHKCRKCMDKTISERVKFVQEKNLCFGCLMSGHRSKECKNKNCCSMCEKRHPTCLHDDRTKEERMATRPDGARNIDRSRERRVERLHDTSARASSEMRASSNATTSSEARSLRVVQNIKDTHTSSIVPVWVSAASEPTNEVLVYALLYTQSDTTFILEDTAKALHTKNEPVQLKLSTMAAKTTLVSCRKLTGLQVRGYFSDKIIPLPGTYTREFIPANRDHIPTPETAMAWPHLEHIAHEIAPLQKCDVGLLIGYNCPQALLTRQVVSSKEDNLPFASRTDLGWSVVGYGNPCLDCGDVIGVSHQVIINQVMPHLQCSSELTSEVHYVLRTQIKELYSPIDVIKVLESDFIEGAPEDDHISQEDIRFLSIMERGIRLKDDGHYEMPLPFKKERPNLPDNKVCAIHCLRCLERKLRKNEKYFKDYRTFMDETISRGDAERVPETELCNVPAWYTPHHGVYHPQKPGKIRVVFDCSAKYKGISLNEHLLTGPELTNNLVGVLCRFRRGPVAIMCDIEHMFHQFHVKAEDQIYLRFLWWDEGNFEAQPSVYRMKVHLFGAASSPGCANYGLKHIATEGLGCFSENTVKFIKRNFYVDDGLSSVESNDQAIQLVKEARELCSSGKLRLHKFISNSKEVIATIPKEECAEAANNLDMAFGELHMERVLGVQWCVASDEFQFRVVVKENPLTRRGVLSTVASVYDPLGFVAPFILIGKQILQQMCRDKLGWDDTLPDELRPLWESWLQDLQNLAMVKIKRCYIPSDFKVQRYELHHFADASVAGYGECSYLRAVSTSKLPSGEVKVGEIESDDPELRKAQVYDTQAEEVRSWVVKAIARLKRHVREIKGLKSRSCEATSLEERREAELTVIKMVQQATLSQEIQHLQRHKEIQTKERTNKLHKLNPFLDNQGIFRVGGRLTHAALHPHVKHPAVLPRDSHVSALLIKHYHEKAHHQGRGMTINELRSNGIWILGCSNAVSSHIYKCTMCRRLRRSTEQQRMADLPEERMETTPPFTYCGIDCFGPFYVKEGRKELKRYGLLLTCMCSRAVHIEALDDLTTDAFINALCAFIAIRGSVRQIRCDRGTNFVGARREFVEALKEMDQEELKEFGCEFLMNSPASSHMGGFWERQIRTIRNVLASILEQSCQAAGLRLFANILVRSHGCSKQQTPNH